MDRRCVCTRPKFPCTNHATRLVKLWKGQDSIWWSIISGCVTYSFRRSSSAANGERVTAGHANQRDIRRSGITRARAAFACAYGGERWDGALLEVDKPARMASFFAYCLAGDGP